MSAELEMESSDARFQQWMRGNLDRAAGHFGLTLSGKAVFGWRLRTIGAPGVGPDGNRWLRVVSEYPQWASGDGWTGNIEANALAGLVKPRVLEMMEWDDGRRQRAEVMTLLPGRPASPTDVLNQVVDLPDDWWTALRQQLDLLRATPTRRVNADQELVTTRALAAFGEDLRVSEWETVHGDLQWTNLLVPQLGILDWELWGQGPAGTDAASLLCHSLPVPEVAERVRSVFSDMLDTPPGRTAQLAVVARMLYRVAGGDYPEMEEPLRRHAASLTRHTTVRWRDH